MFFILCAVAAVVAVCAGIGYYIYKEKKPILGQILNQNEKANNNPPEKKGTDEIKSGNEKKKAKPFLIPDRENSEVRHRKPKDLKKETDNVKKDEVRAENKKPHKNDNKITKRDFYEKYANNANSKKELDGAFDEINPKDEKKIKKKVSIEVKEKEKLKEKLRKSAPVCPKKKFCEEPKCENKSNVLCTECNIHLCNDCYNLKNETPGIHCIGTETMQKIIEPIICEIDKNDTHPIDCFLRKCKHYFHKKCLVANYEMFKKCLHCVHEGHTEEFKLTDISTDFFDPMKYATWKSLPLVIKKEERE
uniref:Uncharacterized protein n=1 Tax=Cacopsylla melanoneura TaxID=428564 RepID=A0A8D8LIL4_9HEMI